MIGLAIVFVAALASALYFTKKSKSNLTFKGVFRRMFLSLAYLYLAFIFVLYVFTSHILPLDYDLAENLGEILNSIEKDMLTREI